MDASYLVGAVVLVTPGVLVYRHVCQKVNSHFASIRRTPIHWLRFSEMVEEYQNIFQAEKFKAATFLEILELNGDEDADAVKRAFRKKVRIAHPDGGGSDSAFIEVNNAYAEAKRHFKME